MSPTLGDGVFLTIEQPQPPTVQHDSTPPARVSVVTSGIIVGPTGPEGPQGETGPEGPQGPPGDGSGGSGDMLAANNLSDVASASTSRTNLGLGTAATHAHTDYDASGAASAAQAAAVASSAQRASNLSDLSSASTARTNLGLGTAATQASGAFDAAGAASTAQAAAIAASDPVGSAASAQSAAIAASAQRASNLSDLANAATARTNLGLGTAAVHATGDYDAAGAASAAQAAAIAASDPVGAASTAQAAAIAASLQRASNLSDLANAGTARTNLGLGTAATHATGDYDAAGAATTAQAAAIAASVQRASNLSDLADAATSRTNLGLGSAATHPVSDFFTASWPKVVTGRWFLPSPGPTTSAAPTKDRLYLIPFAVPTACNLAAIQMNIVIGVATSVVRAALIADTGSLLPGSVIADYGTQSAAATAILTWTIGSPPALTAGTVYWIGVDNQVAAATSWTCTTGNNQYIAASSTDATFAVQAGALFQANVTGAISGTITATGVPLQAPTVALKFS